MAAMPTPDAETLGDNSADTTGVSIVAKMTDTQVFARDPEDYTTETTADTIERLRKILARQRKARADDEAVAATAAKFKKVNAAAARKKLKAGADPMEETIS